MLKIRGNIFLILFIEIYYIPYNHLIKNYHKRKTAHEVIFVNLVKMIETHAQINKFPFKYTSITSTISS